MTDTWYFFHGVLVIPMVMPSESVFVKIATATLKVLKLLSSTTGSHYSCSETGFAVANMTRISTDHMDAQNFRKQRQNVERQLQQMLKSAHLWMRFV
jgi:hypothetical protein